LSAQQEENIEILNNKINSLGETINRLSSQNQDNDSVIISKIDEINELITDFKEEIEEINDDPKGDFPQELYDKQYDDMVKGAKHDYEYYMDMFGLETNRYVDQEKLIEGLIDADGYGPTLNSYDGNAEEEIVAGELFFVMRID
jgi:replication-associated recombination protein RarA